MKGFFKPKPRSPPALVRHAHELLVFIERNDEVRPRKWEEKVSELSKAICEMRTILYGNGETEPSPDACAQLTQEFFSGDTFRLLINCIPSLNSGVLRVVWHDKYSYMQAWQFATHVIANLQKQWVKSRLIASEYLENNMDLMDILIPGYEDCDIALTYGAIARECIRHQCVARYVLESEHMQKFFEYVQNPLFYVASDANATFRVDNLRECSACQFIQKLLTRHKSTVAGFLSKNYDWFIKEYNSQLLESPSYITRRQAIKLLRDILLHNSNAAVRVRYVSSLDNLRISMNLLRDPNKTIQIDAFDVFKLFVANQNKPPEITGVLVANRNKLDRFLNDFLLDKDKQSAADITEVIKEISILEPKDRSSPKNGLV